jgi:hypothetical protein
MIISYRHPLIEVVTAPQTVTNATAIMQKFLFVTALALEIALKHRYL